MVTLHAVEELVDEGFSVLDVEHAILTGKITRRQKDADTGEWKYLVSGRTPSLDEVVVVAKLSPTDKFGYHYHLCRSRLIKPTNWFAISVARKAHKCVTLREVMENVPLISCPHCGESYLTAAILHEIERIKRRRVSLASKRPVAVAVFA